MALVLGGMRGERRQHPDKAGRQALTLASSALWTPSAPASTASLLGLEFLLGLLYFRQRQARLQLESLQAELGRQACSHATLLSAAGAGICGINARGHITFVNPAAQRMLGWEMAELIGADAHALTRHAHLDGSPCSYADCPIHQALHTQPTQLESMVYHYDQEMLHSKDGRCFPIEMAVTLQHAAGRVCGAVIVFNDVTRKRGAASNAEQLAYYDALTQLPNRRLLLERLQQALQHCGHSRREGALLFVDLDNFKLLNDTLGHDVGDQLLQRVAQRIGACLRQCDTVARLGGDEFVIMLEDLDPDEMATSQQALAVSDKILATINQPYALEQHQVFCGSSIGIALFDGSGQHNIEVILKQADLAMYHAKASGRNTACVFDSSMQAAQLARLQLEHELRQGLEQQQFILCYQALVDRNGVVIAAEAQIHWNHPQRGRLPPSAFLAVAETTGLILPLGTWALQDLCRQLSTWASRPEMARLPLTLKIGARQFKQPDFVAQVCTVLEQSGADPQKLNLALSDTLLQQQPEELCAKLNALKRKGVSLTLEAFGAGHSSLSLLKTLPLAQLTIDAGFIKHIVYDPQDLAIVRSIVHLAQSMGWAVMANGVENPQQQQVLAHAGCNGCQGSLFGQPLPGRQFAALQS